MKKRKKENKHLGAYVILRTIKHVLEGDEEYIRKVSEFKEGSDYIEICHNGEKDYGKVVYVIKENTGSDGFCATVIFVLYFLIFAKQHGFVPVIKMSHDFAYYDEEKSNEIANPWEYYFEVSGDAPNENDALNVCYCHYFHRDRMRSMYDLSPYKIENYSDKKVFDLCVPLIREHMNLEPAVKSASENLLSSIKQKGGRVLGVHFRGTDYKKGYNRHPVFVDADQTIEEIRKALAAGKFDAVFIATDDAKALEKIKSALEGTTVICHEDVFRSSGDESVVFSECSRKYHHYLLGYEIARDMYTLSICDGLVAGKSSVSFLSLLYKKSRGEEYEYMHIIDNGNNSNSNEYF